MFGKVYTAVNMDTGAYMAMKEVSDVIEVMIMFAVKLSIGDSQIGQQCWLPMLCMSFFWPAV